MSAVEAYLAEHADRALDDLKAFCRIPSVSTDPAYANGIDAAARFVTARLERAGFANVEIIDTGGHPAVFGEIVSDAQAPTILVYGHYDVQPPDPLAKWLSPPFEPAIRDNRLYARGVSDDKGPLLIPILVAEAFLKCEGRLPVNLKMLVEGEEESGSPHFSAMVGRLSETLACDLVVSADGAMWRADQAVDDGCEPRPLSARRSSGRRSQGTCTRDGMAAARRIRSARLWRCLPLCIMRTARSPSRGFTMGFCRPIRQSSRRSMRRVSTSPPISTR